MVVSKSQIVRNSDRKSNKSSKRRRGAKKGDQMGSHEIARENRGDHSAYEKAQTEAAVSEVQSVMIDLIQQVGPLTDGADKSLDTKTTQ